MLERALINHAAPTLARLKLGSMFNVSRNEGDFDGEAFSADLVNGFDALAFGCPSMGAEQLEETEFEPMFEACKPNLKGKKIALFGSYGWGDGEWMRTWEEDCDSIGVHRVCDSVICNEAPDAEATAACEVLGKALLGKME